ncbi:hypothetical protein F0562_032214 [Nyssa sinensis]|uniref:Uncharacterized protein n=1 Tax=Nyssa sinensis TaxID=561372 RepID=A0A5J5AYY1_9ASTE|nr:hypothetical protein F0562_032214 [Nyssa sinensis]
MNGGAAGGTFDVSILEVELENMWALVESPAAQQDLLKWGIPNSSSAQQQGVKKVRKQRISYVAGLRKLVPEWWAQHFGRSILFELDSIYK